LGVPVVSKTTEEALPHSKFLGMALSRDNPTSNVKTRNQLRRTPEQPTLITNIEEGAYFDD
jgi:hypothetical protein